MSQRSFICLAEAGSLGYKDSVTCGRAERLCPFPKKLVSVTRSQYHGKLGRGFSHLRFPFSPPLCPPRERVILKTQLTFPCFNSLVKLGARRDL